MARIFIYSSNQIGTAMAGPAIRCWEFAKVLGHTHEVFLIAPQATTRQAENFTILVLNDPSYKKLFPTVDVILTQVLGCVLAWKAKRYGIKIILDAYTPTPLERFEQFKQETLPIRQAWHHQAINQLILGFQLADHIICASEKQRDLWIGFLLGQRCFGPSHYEVDASLRHLIDVVPFGLSATAPKKDGPGLREYYSFQPQDSILLWGGGIWNWFDPLSLIQAMKLLHSSHPTIKLVFMGIKNPDPSVKEMKMVQQARQLADTLELTNQTVFFNTGWVPYHERHNFLLDATIGVSTHFEHLETRYAFRTRMLDYLWTQLPILATQGDTFAELIEKHQLGKVVAYQDPVMIQQAIIELIDNQAEREKIKQRLSSISKQFQWQQVIKPLDDAVIQLSHQPKKSLSLQTVKALLKYSVCQLKAKAVQKTCQMF